MQESRKICKKINNFRGYFAKKLLTTCLFSFATFSSFASSYSLGGIEKAKLNLFFYLCENRGEGCTSKRFEIKVKGTTILLFFTYPAASTNIEETKKMSVTIFALERAEEPVLKTYAFDQGPDGQVYLNAHWNRAHNELANDIVNFLEELARKDAQSTEGSKPEL